MLSPCRHRVRSLITEFFTQIEDAAEEQKFFRGCDFCLPPREKFLEVRYSQLTGWTLLPIPVDDNDIDESPHCDEISTT